MLRLHRRRADVQRASLAFRDEDDRASDLGQERFVGGRRIAAFDKIIEPAVLWRDTEFAQAAVLEGVSEVSMMFRQILPLRLPYVMIRLTLDMASVIVTATRDWGFLAFGRSRLRRNREPCWPPAHGSESRLTLT